VSEPDGPPIGSDADETPALGLVTKESPSPPPVATTDAPPTAAVGAGLAPARPDPAAAEERSEPPVEIDPHDYDADVRRELSRLSRRGFLTLAGGGVAAFYGWRYLISRPRENGVALPFRRALQANEALWETLWSPSRLAPTYPVAAAARNPRINGMAGLDRNADPAAWRMEVVGAAAGGMTLALSLADIQALPARELVTELRCVEGWSMVVHWTGARLSDFIARYPPLGRDGRPGDPARPDTLPPFLALETPGRGYYVGLDLQSALHPQTLLAWAINGQPLSWEHGAPLRLVAPMKYGVKNLKRIGTLRYSFDRPGDYWFERGYDWYLGH